MGRKLQSQALEKEKKDETIEHRRNQSKGLKKGSKNRELCHFHCRENPLSTCKWYLRLIQLSDEVDKQGMK